MNDKLKKAFQILDIPEHATLEEAKQAWRDHCQVWHPDKYQSNDHLKVKATEKIKKINGAWDYVKEWFTWQEKEKKDREDRERVEREERERKAREREASEKTEKEREAKELLE